MKENFRYAVHSKKIFILFLSFLLVVQSKPQHNEVMEDQYKKIGPVYFVDACDDHHARHTYFTGGG